MAQPPFQVADTAPLKLVVHFAGERRRPFSKHAPASLQAWEGNDADLLLYASALSGFTPEAIAHDGAVARAKRLLSTSVTQRAPQSGSDLYARCDAVYAQLVAAGVPKRKITPLRLRKALHPEYVRLSKLAWYLEKRVGTIAIPPKSTSLRLTVRFDGILERPLAALRVNADIPEAVRQWQANDAAIVRCASDLSGEPEAAIVRAGALTQAKTLITGLERHRLRPRRDKPTHGVIGSADDRLDVAYAALVASGLRKADITPTRLGQATRPRKTGYRTARTYLKSRGLLATLEKRAWVRRVQPSNTSSVNA